MDDFAPEIIVKALEPFVSENRQSKIDAVLKQRTDEIAIVLDSLYDRGNQSAVLRSAEAFGFLPIHIIEHDQFKAANRVTQGADKWLRIEKWKGPEPCVDELKREHFQIVSMTLDTDTRIEDVDFNRPTAIVFGNEKYGVSDAVLKASDVHCRIPMYGFTQSFNISVAAALTLQHVHRVRKDSQSELSDESALAMRAQYYWKSVHRPEKLVKHFLSLNT